MNKFDESEIFSTGQTARVKKNVQGTLQFTE
jgi:hypothetical protein